MCLLWGGRASDGLWTSFPALVFSDSTTEGKRQLIHWHQHRISKGEFRVYQPQIEKSQGEKLNYNCVCLPNGRISRSAFSAVEVTALAIIFRKNIIHLKTVLAVHCRYWKSVGRHCELNPLGKGLGHSMSRDKPENFWSWLHNSEDASILFWFNDEIQCLLSLKNSSGSWRPYFIVSR